MRPAYFGIGFSHSFHHSPLLAARFQSLTFISDKITTLSHSEGGSIDCKTVFVLESVQRVPSLQMVFAHEENAEVPKVPNRKNGYPLPDFPEQSAVWCGAVLS